MKLCHHVIRGRFFDEITEIAHDVENRSGDNAVTPFGCVMTREAINNDMHIDIDIKSDYMMEKNWSLLVVPSKIFSEMNHDI